MREATAVTEQQKPVVLLHETNFGKGGISLADSMAECAARPDVRDYVFKGRLMVVWMRIQEHQLESLRQITTSLLRSSRRGRSQRPQTSTSMERSAYDLVSAVYVKGLEG